jgi:hypothetical protein
MKVYIGLENIPGGFLQMDSTDVPPCHDAKREAVHL